jgi:8-oxo-dGTP pyrophosphatase MutT (NUDIX family)
MGKRAAARSANVMKFPAIIGSQMKFSTTLKVEMKPTRLSAGVVVLRHEGDTCRYLLLRCFQYWDFPKGMVDEGEQPFAAACREVREESTLDGLDFIWGQVYIETPPYAGGKVARYYIAESAEGEVALPVTEVLGRPEHDEFRWVTYSEARALLGPRLIAVLDWAHRIVAGSQE